jgi:hypothetical protein
MCALYHCGRTAIEPYNRTQSFIPFSSLCTHTLAILQTQSQDHSVKNGSKSALCAAAALQVAALGHCERVQWKSLVFGTQLLYAQSFRKLLYSTRGYMSAFSAHQCTSLDISTPLPNQRAHILTLHALPHRIYPLLPVIALYVAHANNDTMLRTSHNLSPLLLGTFRLQVLRSLYLRDYSFLLSNQQSNSISSTAKQSDNQRIPVRQYPAMNFFLAILALFASTLLAIPASHLAATGPSHNDFAVLNISNAEAIPPTSFMTNSIQAPNYAHGYCSCTAPLPHFSSIQLTPHSPYATPPTMPLHARYRLAHRNPRQPLQHRGQQSRHGCALPFWCRPY